MKNTHYYLIINDKVYQGSDDDLENEGIYYKLKKKKISLLF